jgi:FkbH-like protein
MSDSLSQSPEKLWVVDLDGTLWGGTISEDGIEGILLGGNEKGAYYEMLQGWLAELHNNGMYLIALSRNTLADALSPFALHSSMKLKASDFLEIFADPIDKLTLWEKIFSTTPFMQDEIVYLDNDPVERMRVKEAYPSIKVIDLPGDVSEWFPVIRTSRNRPQAATTYEDKVRLDHFSLENKRLGNLGLKATLRRMTENDIPRVIQLSQRVHQFNTTYVTYDRQTLLSPEETQHFLVCELTDNSGDYGLVGFMDYRLNDSTLQLRQWLISCRALGRGLEQAMLNTLLELFPCRQVFIDFKLGTRNIVVKDFLGISGALEKQGGWEVQPNSWTPLSTSIIIFYLDSTS